MPKSLKGALSPAAPVAAYPALKASIVLFDYNPGTRSWTVPEGVSQIRAFVVGGGGYNRGSGGGYAEKLISVISGQIINYTVGARGVPAAATGGASSFGGSISATGGATTGGTVGSGVGGDTNTSGGAGNVSADPDASGGGAGHAFGNGQPGARKVGGGFSANQMSFVDGWRIGLLSDSYGRGGMSNGTSLAFPAGIGGGASGATSADFIADAIIGGGGGNNGNGGTGLVGIEVIA